MHGARGAYWLQVAKMWRPDSQVALLQHQKKYKALLPTIVHSKILDARLVQVAVTADDKDCLRKGIDALDMRISSAVADVSKLQMPNKI